MTKILLVEDDETLATLLRGKLEKEGYVVAVALDGESGLAQLRSTKPDLLLLDIILPKLSGFDILETMQQDATLAHPPTIIISNSGQPVEVERAKALGAIDYLVKANLDPKDVLEKVQENLAGSTPAVDTAPVSRGAPGGSGRSVLVVEDDKFLRDLLVQKLKREGFSIIEAITGSDALRLAKESHPSIVLLDLILPGLDGFEILKRLKEDAATAPIPVIILSNLGQREDVERGLRLGAIDFMIKAHFTPGEIVGKIKETLGKSAAS